MLITGVILLGCLTPSKVDCARPATVAACASSEKVLPDCQLEASEDQIVVALRVASAVRFSCAASASAVRRLRQVCPCRVAGRQPLRLPAASSLSSLEELCQESDASLLGLSATALFLLATAQTK